MTFFLSCLRENINQPDILPNASNPPICSNSDKMTSDRRASSTSGFSFLTSCKMVRKTSSMDKEHFSIADNMVSSNGFLLLKVKKKMLEKKMDNLQKETGWTSPSRLMGELCERYVAQCVSCPRCETNGVLRRLPTNTPCVDAVCVDCGQCYQIKGVRNANRCPSSVLGGEYQTTVKGHRAQRIDFLVVVCEDLRVFHMKDYRIFPRKPLSPNARRAGWQGCVIRFKGSGTLLINFPKWGAKRPRSRRFIPRTAPLSRRTFRRAKQTGRCRFCNSDT